MLKIFKRTCQLVVLIGFKNILKNVLENINLLTCYKQLKFSTLHLSDVIDDYDDDNDDYDLLSSIYLKRFLVMLKITFNHRSLQFVHKKYYFL